MKYSYFAALVVALSFCYASVEAAPLDNAKAAEDALAEVLANKESWQTCMTQTTLRMGQNSEDASTVVRAAQARCLETNGQNLRMLPNVIMIHEMRSILAAGLAGAGGVSSAQIRAKAFAEVEQFKQQAADKAIAALLEERSRTK